MRSSQRSKSARPSARISSARPSIAARNAGAPLAPERALERRDVLGHLGPLARHLARDLEVELHAVGTRDPERLVRVGGRAGQPHGAFREVEGVAVPLKRHEVVRRAAENRVVRAPLA